METSPELLRRKEKLNKELVDAIDREARLARLDYRSSAALVVIAIGCSVTAAIGGLFFDMPGKIAGGFAAVTPLVAFIATNVKLDGKSSWHYRKRDALNALRSRLNFQQPESFTADNIASVAADRDKLDAKMQKEFDEHLAFNWNALLRGHHHKQ